MTTPAVPSSAGTLSRSEAVIALLIAGARSDGTVSSHEANQIEHVVSTMRLFRGSTPETRHAMITAVTDRLKTQGMDTVVREAARTIPKELAATAFALTVDLMLLDGQLTANEERFANELREALDIDRERARKIIDVLAIKNAG